MDKTHTIPINRTAVNVIKNGIHYEYDGVNYQRHHPNKIPIRQVPKDTEDLTGIKYGRFTVIGLYHERKKNRNIKVYLLPNGGAHIDIKKGKRKEMAQRSLWVVRCCCGNYETRRAKSIRNRDDKECQDRCGECQHLRRLKIHDFFNRMGRWPENNEID